MFETCLGLGGVRPRKKKKEKQKRLKLTEKKTKSSDLSPFRQVTKLVLVFDAKKEGNFCFFLVFCFFVRFFFFFFFLFSFLLFVCLFVFFLCFWCSTKEHVDASFSYLSFFPRGSECCTAVEGAQRGHRRASCSLQRRVGETPQKRKEKKRKKDFFFFFFLQLFFFVCLQQAEHDDIWLLRYILSRKTVDKAEPAVRKGIEWRKANESWLKEAKTGGKAP